MPDRFINWTPPLEALEPLVGALARAAAERDFQLGRDLVEAGGTFGVRSRRSMHHRATRTSR